MWLRWIHILRPRTLNFSAQVQGVYLHCVASAHYVPRCTATECLCAFKLCPLTYPSSLPFVSMPGHNVCHTAFTLRAPITFALYDFATPLPAVVLLTLTPHVQVLQSYLPAHFSRSRVQRALKNHSVLINGEPASKPSIKVRAGDQVHILILILISFLSGMPALFLPLVLVLFLVLLGSPTLHLIFVSFSFFLALRLFISSSSHSHSHSHSFCFLTSLWCPTGSGWGRIRGHGGPTPGVLGHGLPQGVVLIFHFGRGAPLWNPCPPPPSL